MNLYAPLVVAALALAAFLVRKYAPNGHFFQSSFGAFVIALVSGILSAAASAAETHGLSLEALIPAVASFILSLVATGNPSVDSEGKSKLASMVPLILLSALTAGCGTLGGQALKNCELQALPSTLNSVTAGVVAVATDPSSAPADFDQLARQVAPTQFTCILQAVLTWVTELTTGQKGQVMQRYQHAKTVLKAYLDSGSSVACSGSTPTL